MDPFFPKGMISLSAKVNLNVLPKFTLKKCGSILFTKKDMMVDQTTSKTQHMPTHACLTAKSAKN